MRIYWNKIAKAKCSTTEGEEKNWTMSIVIIIIIIIIIGALIIIMMIMIIG